MGEKPITAEWSTVTGREERGLMWMKGAWAFCAGWSGILIGGGLWFGWLNS